METGELCPVCGKPLIYKQNRKGQSFVGCSGFPSCTFIKREEKEEPEEVGEVCPDCGKPLIYKKNKKGEKFIGCSGFPTCRYTRSLVVKPVKKKTKTVYTEADYVRPCPKCGKGFLVKKKGKKTEFLGCTNFPKCRHVEWLKDEKK